MSVLIGGHLLCGFLLIVHSIVVDSMEFRWVTYEETMVEARHMFVAGGLMMVIAIVGGGVWDSTRISMDRITAASAREP